MELRVARQTTRLYAVVAFYRDGLELPELGGFTGHDGYNGVMLEIPDTGTHLEFTETAHLPPPVPHPESLLVLYLGSAERVHETLKRLGASPVPAANPYWDRHGVTVQDPDGFRVVLVANRWVGRSGAIHPPARSPRPEPWRRD